jgi:valyl-tRNA synthetase
MTPIKAAILGPRQIRGQLNVPQSRAVTVYFKTPHAEDERALADSRAVVAGVGNIKELRFITDDGSLPPAAIAIVDGRSIYAPLSELIDDVDAELARLAKRKAKIAQEVARCEAKLGSENFVKNAPPEVVEQERNRIAEFRREIEQIEQQQQRVAKLKSGA